MRRYDRGILVKVIESGRAKSGRVYGPSALADIERHINHRVVPVRLGHGEDAVYLGQIVSAESDGRTVWGQLAGLEPRELMAMHEGARQRGIDVLGMSIRARAVTDPDTRQVGSVSLLESVDVCTVSTPIPSAGGRVEFGDDGLPVAWEQRYDHWRLAVIDERMTRLAVVAEARAGVREAVDRWRDTMTEALTQQIITAQKRGPVVAFREDGGRLLSLIA